MEARVYLVTVLAVGSVATAAALFYAWESPLPPIDPHVSARATDRDRRNGEQACALLGDCSKRAIRRPGAPYAGGLAIELDPPGTIFSTETSAPDPETGIAIIRSRLLFAPPAQGSIAKAHLIPAFLTIIFTRVSDDFAARSVRLLHVPRSGQFLDTAEPSLPLSAQRASYARWLEVAVSAPGRDLCAEPIEG